MPKVQHGSEEEVARLVHHFYAAVRADRKLGPIFEKHVGDWDRHLAKMVDFWSSALRGTARYRGTPMPAHVALPNLSGELFARWLGLFRLSTQVFEDAQARERVDELALRIAQSLWAGYQLHRNPGRAPDTLSGP